MTEEQMDDERFMALVEGLTALSMLEKLLLTGFCGQVPLFHVIRSGRRLSKALKQAIEEMRNVYWPLQEEIVWL
jgi:hypothetical protein